MSEEIKKGSLEEGLEEYRKEKSYRNLYGLRLYCAQNPDAENAKEILNRRLRKIGYEDDDIDCG